MNIAYNKESFAQCGEEIKDMIHLHYEEISKYYGVLECEADWDKYAQMCELGLLQIVTVRDNGVLVGYCADVISPSLHYKHDLFAVNDVIFVKKDYRNFKVASKLLDFVIELLIKQKVSVHHLHMKADQPFCKLVERKDYELMDLIYSRHLERND